MSKNKLHETAYQFLEAYRAKHPGFHYWLRKNDRKDATTGQSKFRDGIWFQGNQNYVFAGLYDRSGGSNMTRSFGIVFQESENKITVFIELVHNEEKDNKVLDFYQKVMKQMGGFEKVGKTKYRKFSEGSDYLKNLTSFLDNEKPAVDQLVRDLELDHLFITKEKFKKLHDKILGYRQEKETILGKYIQAYKRLIQSEEYDEIYKWQTIQYFQDNWSDDHTVETILDNLKQSFNKASNNLWSGSHYLPYKMMLDFANQNPTLVSEMFHQLFDESKEVDERMEFFQRKSEELLKSYSDDESLSHYQGQRALFLYLSLKYPDKYYLYKNSMYNDFCTITGFRPKPGSGKKYNYAILKNYREMCDAVRAILIGDKELLEIHKKIIPDDITFEDDHHLLTQDFIYCVSTYLKHKLEEQKEATKNISDMENKTPLNTILYGPPGTGKTYHTKNLAVKIIENLTDEELEEKYEDRSELNRQYNSFVEDGYISFVTFHQSFSYEDFVEGIKPVLKNDEEESDQGDGDIGYRIEEGVFKEIADRAASYETYADEDSQIKIDAAGDIDLEKVYFFKMSLGNSQLSEDDAIYQYCIENDCIALGWGGDTDYTNIKDEQSIIKTFKENALGDYSPYSITAIKCFRSWMREGDIVFIANGNKNVRAIGLIDSDYYYKNDSDIRYKHYRSVRWLVKDVSIPVNEVYKRQFSQQTIYQMYTNLVNKDFFTNQEQKPVKHKNHVLIIDEINRGNIASIFGELITLIEPDKRIGGDESIVLQLPYSKQPFGVPQNLYIIGTMNTADRSIEALDTALRRRFSFEEVPPKYDLNELDYEVFGFKATDILKTINNRIEKLLDRDHAIGHSYFINKDESTVMEAFYKNIIPLLQEYFYGDYGKIGLVLGKGFVDRKNGNKSNGTFATFDYDGADDFADREIFEIIDYRKGEHDSSFEKAIKDLMNKPGA